MVSWEGLQHQFELLERAHCRLMIALDRVPDEVVFLDMLEYRNLTSHTYDEANAEAVYQFIANRGSAAIEDIISKLHQRILRMKE